MQVKSLMESDLVVMQRFSAALRLKAIGYFNQPETLLDGMLYTPSFNNSQFARMVKAVDALRDELVQEHPYTTRWLPLDGYVSDDTPFSEIRFEYENDRPATFACSPQIRWTTKTKSFLGRTDFRTNGIYMNAWMDVHQALDVLRHEYAHMTTNFISRSRLGHRRVWREWADRLGMEPERCFGVFPRYYWMSRRIMKLLTPTDKKLWFAPIARLESKSPHDWIYEGRHVVERRLGNGGMLTKYLVELHSNRSDAIAIATDDSLPYAERIESLSREVLPKRSERLASLASMPSFYLRFDARGRDIPKRRNRKPSREQVDTLRLLGMHMPNHSSTASYAESYSSRDAEYAIYLLTREYEMEQEGIVEGYKWD